MLYRGLSVLRTALALIVLLCAGRALAAVHVAPTIVTLTENQTVGALTLTNRGGQTTTFEARLFNWSITENQDELESTRELLVSPPAFTLEAGESQTVRIALLTPFPKQEEASYRIIFRELPSTKQEGPGIGLQVAMQISIPVFVQPKKSAPARVRWSAELNKQNDLIVVAKNNGGRHFKLTQLQLKTGNGAPLTAPWQGLFYLLPGTRRQWQLTPHELLQTGDPVIITTQTGRNTQDVHVQLQ